MGATRAEKEVYFESLEISFESKRFIERLQSFFTAKFRLTF